MAEQHHGHHHFELPGQHDVKKAKKHDEKLVKPDIDDATDEELDQYSRDDKEGKQLRSQYQKLVAKDRRAARKEAKKRRREYEDFMEENRRHARKMEKMGFMEQNKESNPQGFAFPNTPGPYGYHNAMGSNGHRFYNRYKHGRYYGEGNLDRDPDTGKWTGHMRDPHHKEPRKGHKNKNHKHHEEAEDEDLVEDQARFGQGANAMHPFGAPQAGLQPGGGFGAGTLPNMYGATNMATGPIKYYGHGLFDHRNVGGDQYAYGIHLPFPEAGFPFGHSYFSHGRFYRYGGRNKRLERQNRRARKLDHYRFGGGFGYGHNLPYPNQRLPMRKHWKEEQEDEQDEE